MGAEYKAAISRTGGAALGALQSTHLCIVATKSTLTPARALLDHRQARSDYWSDPRGKGAGDPQAAVRADGQNQERGGAEAEEEVKNQGREHLRALPGDLLVYDEGGALAAAKERTYWADGSKLDNGSVRAVAVYDGRDFRPPYRPIEEDAGWVEGQTLPPRKGWRGLDAEVFTIHRSENLRQMERDQHSLYRFYCANPKSGDQQARPRQGPSEGHQH